MYKGKGGGRVVGEEGKQWGGGMKGGLREGDEDIYFLLSLSLSPFLPIFTSLSFPILSLVFLSFS